MAWSAEDGEHDGWAAAVFPDFPADLVDVRTSDAGVAVRPFIPGAGIVREAGSEPEVRDGRQAAGWRGVCECGWWGPLWKRVTTPAEHSLTDRRVYQADPSVYGDPPAEVDDAIHREWKDHLEPVSLVAVREAASDVRAATARLDNAVYAARRDGRSWAAIGTAAGITRQSAYERWAKNAPATDPKEST